MRKRAIVFLCLAVVGCAPTHTPVTAQNGQNGRPNMMQFRYTRIPPADFTLASTMIIRLGGWHSAFANPLGRDVTVNDIAAHIRRWKGVQGGPMIVVLVGEDEGEAVLQRTATGVLAIDEALASAGVNRADVQVIFEFPPVRNNQARNRPAELPPSFPP